MSSYATVDQLRAYLPQVSDLGQQTITLGTSAPGDMWTLSYEESSTSQLFNGATATAVQSALRQLSAIGSTGVIVRGSPGGPYVATFQGTLATDAAPLSGQGYGVDGAPVVTVAPSTDQLLAAVLARASGTVRDAMRSLLADPTFDYAAYGVASPVIVYGVQSTVLRLPPYAAGSVSSVAWQVGSNPAVYQAIPDQWIEESGSLYRAAGWVSGMGSVHPRNQITAQWGYGETIPAAIEEVTLELAVNIWRSRDKGGFSEMVGVEGSGAIRSIAGLTKSQMAVLVSVRDQLIMLSV